MEEGAVVESGSVVMRCNQCKRTFKVKDWIWDKRANGEVNIYCIYCGSSDTVLEE